MSKAQLYFFVQTAILSLLAGSALAWTASSRNFPPIAPASRLSATRSDRDGTSQSRRQWLWGISNAIACTSLIPSRSLAAPPPLVSTAATCDPTVSVWQRKDRLVYLLGTAHISSVSASLAGQLVRDIHPNAVFIELDLKRVGGLAVPPRRRRGGGALTNMGVDQAPPPTSRLIVPVSVSSAAPSVRMDAVYQASRSTSAAAMATMVADGRSAVAATAAVAASPQPGGFGLNLGAAAVGNALRGMYKNLNDAGFSPGEEFVNAVREGQNIGADIVLGDRDMDITMRRLTQALAMTDMNKLLDPNSTIEQSMRELLPGGGGGPPPNDADAFREEMTYFVEAIKSRERVRKIMAELKEIAPALVQVMLTERDAFMAAGLDTLNQYGVIVAVMGMAHQDGVEGNLKSLGWKQVRPRCRK